MKAFRYPLDPVLRQHEWEIAALKLELATLNQALALHEAALAGLEASIGAAEQEIVAICGENAIIARGRKEIVELYLRDLRVRADQKREETERVGALAAGVLAQLSRARQAQRVIEKHRARKQKEFEAGVLRQEALENDALWLARMAAVD